MNLGPDGMFIVYALVVSVALAGLRWLRVGIRRAAVLVLAVAAALALVQYISVESADVPRQLVRASFILVPTLLLVAVAQVAWLASRAWALLVLGPVLFVGCYVGICELCVKAGII